ncbi:hypothetical protein EON81_09335 [bacterium]|nr:MAG: hypothetical protein EON81_09335 [bacterium]
MINEIKPGDRVFFEIPTVEPTLSGPLNKVARDEGTVTRVEVPEGNTGSFRVLYEGGSESGFGRPTIKGGAIVKIMRGEEVIYDEGF